MDEYPVAPQLEFFASATVEVDPPIEIGQTIDGMRKLIPIRGGRVRGRGWNGRVLDAGADFQLYPSATTSYLHAVYVIEAEDGSRLFVDNQALRTGSAADLAKLVGGEPVDPARIYFRFTPRVTTAVDNGFAWVNDTVFLGSGRRLPGAVQLDFFAVR
ncbi:DUF3237 family protein [Glutamicibacter sp. MNS18]|uniref:DUF3237 family protein n=1 Tax=Glutamicibacter sp. MNS18 TaxID=2989817 RepID=UPI00223622F1|nr:DUF3237 family protein [Glutamicibacter sp. MNS18]MCW4466233.1 DUF3237 family protein [Glutamicibacter sp. MNS18]